MAGWADIGAALTGNTAGNELAYQKGLSLGAATQDAMQKARERVRQNTAMEQLPSLADQLGIPAAFITAIQAGVNPTEIANTAKTRQEVALRDRAADPNATPEEANVALRGVANAPVERYYKVGGSVGDKFASGLTPNPTPSDSGDAAPIQVLRAFGLLDDSGHVPADNRRQAFDVMRSTARTVDLGGVPATVDSNPFAAMVPPAPMPGPMPGPMPASAAPGDLSSLVPPAQPVAPVPLPPVAGPAPAAAPAARPVSTAADVAANAATIAKAKEIGKGQGEAAAKLPTTVGTFKSMSSAIDGLLGQPGFDSIYGNIRGTGIGQEVTKALSQDAANADAAREQLKSQGFTVAIQKMRGLGQLSNAEGSKVEAALSRLWNPRISPPEARAAAAELKQSLAAMEQTARAEAGDAAVDAILGGAAPTAGGASAPAAAVSLDAFLKSKGF